MQDLVIENNVRLDRLLTSHPDMERGIRDIVRIVLSWAEQAVGQDADQQSKRNAAAAVRMTVYKNVLGGNLNILDSRKRTGAKNPIPPVSGRKTSNAVGGNRIPRSRRTEDLLTYTGPDIAFILRFLNNGTETRTSRYGNRGAIAARNWFGISSRRELERAAGQFDKLLGALIEQHFNEEKI